MFDQLLIHTAEIRRQGTRLDRLKQPVDADRDAAPDLTVRCRLSTGKASERFTERARDVVVSSHTVFLPLGTEVFESDRITVKNAEGVVLVDFADCIGVTRPENIAGPHHVEAKIDATRSGTDAQ